MTKTKAVVKGKPCEYEGHTVLFFDMVKGDGAKYNAHPDREIAFNQLMRKYAGSYYSPDMAMWRQALHCAVAGYTRFFKKEKVVQELNVDLMNTRKRTILTAISCSFKVPVYVDNYFRYVSGIAMCSYLVEFKNLETRKSRVSGFSPVPRINGFSGFEKDRPNPNYFNSLVLSSILHGCSFEEAREIHPNGFPVQAEGDVIKFYMFNPTKRRVENSIDDFKRFSEYAGRRKDDIAAITNLLMAANSAGHIFQQMPMSSACELISAGALEFKRSLRQEAGIILAKMKVPDFSNLEKRVMENTVTWHL